MMPTRCGSAWVDGRDLTGAPGVRLWSGQQAMSFSAGGPITVRPVVHI